MIERSKLAQSMVTNDQELRGLGVVMDDIEIESFPDPSVTIDGKEYISFSSNNYLGLSKRPEVMTAAIGALEKYGPGTCESRRLGGDLEVLEELEQVIADFKGTEDSIIFATGLMANIGAIPAILDSDFYVNKFFELGRENNGVVVLSDQLNHRSIQMGIKLSHAKLFKFAHKDMSELEYLLDVNKDHPILVISDGVFSMDGDMAPLDEITRLSRRYGAAVYIDDAHGVGVNGENGKGTAEHFGVESDIEFQMGTLSKALGGLGGYVAAEKGIVDMFKDSVSTYYFTSSLPAEQAAGLIAAFNIIKKEPQLRKNLWRNVFDMISGLKSLGLEFPLQWSQIIPISIGNEEKTLDIERYLLDRGIQCSGVTPPAVAKGKSRLRISINATHTSSHISKLLECLDGAAKDYDLPRNYRSDNEWKDFMESTPNYIAEFLR